MFNPSPILQKSIDQHQQEATLSAAGLPFSKCSAAPSMAIQQ